LVFSLLFFNLKFPCSKVHFFITEARQFKLLPGVINNIENKKTPHVQGLYQKEVSLHLFTSHLHEQILKTEIHNSKRRKKAAVTPLKPNLLL